MSMPQDEYNQIMIFLELDSYFQILYANSFHCESDIRLQLFQNTFTRLKASTPLPPTPPVSKASAIKRDIAFHKRRTSRLQVSVPKIFRGFCFRKVNRITAWQIFLKIVYCFGISAVISQRHFQKVQFHLVTQQRRGFHCYVGNS